MGKELELQRACQNSDADSVKKILQKHCKSVQKRDRSSRLGAFSSKRAINVNYQDESGRTCLHFAATVGDVGMIEDLTLCSADPGVKEARGQTSLHYAAMHNKSPGVVEMLVRHGSPLNLQDIHLNSALHLAAMFGNIVAVRELLGGNADVCSLNEKGYTPMDLACLHGHFKVVTALLLAHSDTLLSMGTVAARTDEAASTPLHLAARKGHTETCLTLLKHGMNVNRESSSGIALHEAVLHSRLEVTQLLCDQGSDVTIKNVHGQTPLDVAQKLSAAHSADKLASIISNFQHQEAMVGMSMEDCIPEQLGDLDAKFGELVHILSKNADGRWRAFVVRGTAQKEGYIPWYKLELLSAQCKPATHMRASSQVLSERDVSQFGSSHSLSSDHPPIPGNEREHSVAVKGVSVNEQSARLLLNPEVSPCNKDARAALYDWLNEAGLGQHLPALLDAGYGSPPQLAGITEAELLHVGISDSDHRTLLLRRSQGIPHEKYSLCTQPDSIKEWLGALGLARHSSLFASAGYNSLEDLVGISAGEFVRLGVTKPGHRTKLLAASCGLRDWLSGRTSSPRPGGPRKPVRSLSKTSTVSDESPPVSAGLRLQDEPICNAYWESFPVESCPVERYPAVACSSGGSSYPPVACSSEGSYPAVACSSQRSSYPTGQCPFGDEDSEDEIVMVTQVSRDEVVMVSPVSTNPFGLSSDEEDLTSEMTATIKPKRTSKPSRDGLSTLQRERIFTLEREIVSPPAHKLLSATKHLSPIPPTPPLSPNPDSEEEGDVSLEEQDEEEEDVLSVHASASNTSVNSRAGKRGSSEHLDPMSPPPKMDSLLGSMQDCVDLIRESTPSSGDDQRSSPRKSPPPSPKGYYESDILVISNEEREQQHVISNEEREQQHVNPHKPMRRSVTSSAILETPRGDDICDSCKLRDHPDLLEHKRIFLERLEQRMSSSDAMKMKKSPPPVAPKPKYSLKKANTVATMSVSRKLISDTPPRNGLEGHGTANGSTEDMTVTPVNQETLPSPSREKSSTSVFDDLENMFDEFSKELDSFVT